MSSLKWIIAVFVLTASDVFLSSTAAQDSYIGDKNCVTIKLKNRPFRGQNAIWRSPFEKAFTEQEIETAMCAADGVECFAGVFTGGSNVKGLCKTQYMEMTVEMYRTDIGVKAPRNVNSIPIGCYCQLHENQYSTYDY